MPQFRMTFEFHAADQVVAKQLAEEVIARLECGPHETEFTNVEILDVEWGNRWTV